MPTNATSRLTPTPANPPPDTHTQQGQEDGLQPAHEGLGSAVAMEHAGQEPRVRILGHWPLVIQCLS